MYSSHWVQILASSLCSCVTSAERLKLSKPHNGKYCTCKWEGMGQLGLAYCLSYELHWVQGQMMSPRRAGFLAAVVITVPEALVTVSFSSLLPGATVGPLEER